MSQTAQDASPSLADPSSAALTPSRRTAQFGVALITLLLVTCFGVLIAARADHAPAAERTASHIAR